MDGKCFSIINMSKSLFFALCHEWADNAFRTEGLESHSRSLESPSPLLFPMPPAFDKYFYFVRGVLAGIPHQVSASRRTTRPFTFWIQFYSGEAAREGEAEQLESEVALG